MPNPGHFSCRREAHPPLGALLPHPERRTPAGKSVCRVLGDIPHAPTLRAEGKRAAGPGHRPQGRAAEGGRVPELGEPSEKHEASPHPEGTLLPP